MADILDYEEQKAMIEHLSAYQRRGEDRSWKEYQKKILTPLLEKWGMVLHECRMNGFINPVVYGEKLNWHQIIGDNTHTDQCTVCPATSKDGSCKGKMGLHNGQMNFVPCWK